MVCNGYDDVLDMKAGELIELRDARGATMRVTRGALWVTQDRDVRDIVLRAGDVFTIERDGLTLAEAQGSATLCLVHAAARRVQRNAAVPTAAERLAAWFAALVRRYNGSRFVPYY